MKNSLLFIIIFAIAILGAVGLFYLESKIPDNELLNRDINATLLKIDNLDSNINELTLRNRANLDLNYDMLVRSTTGLQRTITELESNYFKGLDISGSLLESKLNNFTSTVEVKLDQVENFKSNNSVLRNSEKYAPLVGSELVSIASENELLNIADMYQQAIFDVLEFTKQASNVPVLDVSAYIQGIDGSISQMPESSHTKILEFSNHIATAIEAKQKTDLYLNNTLNSSLNTQIEDIFNAWSLWQTQNNNHQQVLKYYSIAYIAIILGLLSLLIFRLRSLYNNLDSEVAIKTQKIEAAYKNLQESEQKLNQSEKMASLGQLVAGVAHEVNTPLGYISSNIGTVKSKLQKLTPVLEKAKALSDAASQPSPDKSIFNQLLKQQIVDFRQAGKNNTPNKLIDLLDDSSEGLNDIQEMVDSLVSFSHIEDAPFQEVDVNECIKKALKICQHTLNERKVSLELNENLPSVMAAQGQLVQVFTNIITNAAHATDDAEGRIAIQTFKDGDWLSTVVQDNGSGISEELVNRVFDPFFTTKDVGQGVGLGLSLAYKILNSHNGEINLISKEGMGTSLTINLPLINET